MAEADALPLRKRFERRAGGCLLGGLAWVVRLMPGKMVDGFGVMVGKLAYRCSRRYREQAYRNLRMCYPEWTERKVRETAKAVFAHFGKTGARFFRKPTDAEVSAMPFDGIEHVHAALSAGKGALLIGAHLGNWERLSHSATLAGVKLSVVARDANVRGTTDLLNEQREQSGIEVFSRGKAAREILRRLAKNEAIGILADQNSGEVIVPFFGFPTGTTRGPAIFHLRTGAPIVMTFCVENPDGSYSAHAEPLEMPVLTGNQDSDAEALMAAINLAIEKEVRQHPEQWLWMHDRWRHARRAGLLG